MTTAPYAGLRGDGTCSRCGEPCGIVYRITRDNPGNGRGPEPLDAEPFCSERCIGEWYLGMSRGSDGRYRYIGGDHSPVPDGRPPWEIVLSGWAALDRDALIRCAVAGGVRKSRIHAITGISRTTIDRIFEGD